MAKFMGVNIAGLVNKHISKRINDIQLIVVTPLQRTEGSTTGGMGKTTSTYPGKGFVEDYAADLVDGTIISKNDRIINIIALSILNRPVPKPGDRVVAEGVTYNIIKVKRDPAGAMYTCQGRAGS